MSGNLKNTEQGGRPKGVKNKFQVHLFEALQAAFDKAGGTKYLYDLSQEHPKIFAQLLAKVMPNDINVFAEVNVIHHDIDDLQALDRYCKDGEKVIEGIVLKREETVQ